MSELCKRFSPNNGENSLQQGRGEIEFDFFQSRFVTLQAIA